MGWRNAVDFYGDGYFESGTSFALKFGTGRFVRLDPTSATTLDLPDATTLPNWVLGGPVWTVQNTSSTNDITVRDGDGTTVATLTASPTGSEYDTVEIYLADNSTSAGDWHFKTGQAGSATAPGVDEKVYWLGGQTSSAIEGDIADEYDIDDDAWTARGEASDLLASCGAGIVSDKGYIVGGNATADKETRSYDPGFDVWADLTAIPTGRTGSFSGAVSGTDLFIQGAGEAPFNIPDGLEDYDTVGDSWSTKVDRPLRADDIFAQGYAATSSIFTYGTDQNFERDTSYEYDVADESWSQSTDLAFPGRVSGGGVDDEDNETTYGPRGFDDVLAATDAVWWHDMSADTYQTKADHPETGGGNQGTSRAAGRIFHGGGGSNDTTHWEYTPVLDSWSQKTDIPREKQFSYDHMQGINAG